MQGTIELCDNCGASAAYTVVRGGNRLSRPDQLCEDCARRNGNETGGEVYMVAKTLGFAAQNARDLGLSDDEIRGMLEAVLTAPHSSGYYPMGGDQVVPDWKVGIRADPCGGVMAPVLTLHQGDAKRTFAEHPTEVARQALISAADVEEEPWALLLCQFAARLPQRAPIREPGA